MRKLVLLISCIFININVYSLGINGVFGNYLMRTMRDSGSESRSNDTTKIPIKGSALDGYRCDYYVVNTNKDTIDVYFDNSEDLLNFIFRLDPNQCSNTIRRYPSCGSLLSEYSCTKYDIYTRYNGFSSDSVTLYFYFSDYMNNFIELFD